MLDSTDNNTSTGQNYWQELYEFILFYFFSLMQNTAVQKTFEYPQHL